MATIPENRIKLLAIADKLAELDHNDLALELSIITYDLIRKPSIRPITKTVSRPMTLQLWLDIREYASLHPELGMRQIGQYFNVSQGRVSEAINGKRY